MNVLDKINFKDESWKFTPKHMLKEDFLMSEGSFKESVFYLGPDEETLSEQTWKDLESQGYIEFINTSESSIINLKKTKEVQKASLSSYFENEISNKEVCKIKFLKNLPSPLWVTVGNMPSRVEFVIEDKLNIQMVFIEKEKSEGGKLLPIDFVLGEGAKADIFFNFRASGKAALNLNSVLGVDSEYRIFTFCGGKADYKRLELRCFQTSKNSEVTVNGLSLVRNKSVIDYHTDIFHLAENQKSNQRYKTIGSGESKNIFGGRIHLTPPSEGAEVEQLNKNILLTKKATVDSQPELNIDQDDVKATHGATISSLDDEHFFYLASRGFTKEDARKLLVDAFCKDALLKDVNQGINEYFTNQILEDLANV